MSSGQHLFPPNDDVFHIPLSQTPNPLPHSPSSTSIFREPLKPSNNLHPPPPRKKLKPSSTPGKENIPPSFSSNDEDFEFDENCSLDFIESSIDCSYRAVDESVGRDEDCVKDEGLKGRCGYSSNSIEARLMRVSEDDRFMGFEESHELDVLIRLCSDEVVGEGDGVAVQCPVCGTNISDLSEESRTLHTNDCLDKEETTYAQDVVLGGCDKEAQFPAETVDAPLHSLGQVVDVSPVVKWLRDLGLEKYEEAFVKEEINMDALEWLTEEDLFSIGVTALGPRKKIMHALDELRRGGNLMVEVQTDAQSINIDRLKSKNGAGLRLKGPKVISDETSKPASNKLITDFFTGSNAASKKVSSVSKEQQQQGTGKQDKGSAHKRPVKSPANNRKLKNIPSWCSIPGTAFRVDAFKYLRGDCTHWFLTHFHMDHYQGLTRSFCHGKIYCSLITAKLVNMKIGIPWDRLLVLPLNQRMNISGVYVTCLDANHCPGSIIILFEPPNGKAVLHTGDFRFSEKMATTPLLLQACPIHTLILDTTYCNAQYDFPKQEAVIQFVIEAIQAEAFNPKTLFLIGSYTIGKERLFLEVARFLRRKVHVTAAKFRLIECLDFSQDDMRWFTLNPQESNIHVVPMWTLASFKRLKHMSSQYADRFSLIVAFSPTGWTFGKGKKKSPGRRWQQGTIIRYEVPYSEHSSYTELKEFVKLVSPEKIIPSVNNDGADSANAMVSLLLS